MDGFLVRYEELAAGEFGAIERYLGFGLSSKAASVRPDDGPRPLDAIAPEELAELETEVGQLAASLGYRYETKPKSR